MQLDLIPADVVITYILPFCFTTITIRRLALTRDTVCAFMLARARLYCVSVLKRKRSVISGTQRNIKREIEMRDSRN